MQAHALDYPFATLATRSGTSRTFAIAAALSTVVLALATFTAVQMTGGSPNALNNIGYVAIVLAAYLFGWKSALAVGLLTAFLLGPTASMLGLPHNESPHGWLVRGAAYVGIGAITGSLFDRLRAAVARWQATVHHVEGRHRDALFALARGAEAKDTDTGEHILRVQLTSTELARAAGLSGVEADRIGWAAMLHDVGKLHVPDEILTKPGPLTPDEWAVMRRHPIWGTEILGDSEQFDMARGIARWHHENFDGSGYPDGLAGDKIAFEARIVRIADSFDAMTNDRPYAPGRSIEDALEELDRWSNRQFDPELARLMIELVRSDASMRQRLAAIALRERGRFAA